MLWDEELYRRLVDVLAASGDVDDLDETEERDTRALFWTTFGPMFMGATPLHHGTHAQRRYAEERPNAIVILSQPSRTWTPHGACSPSTFALLCSLRKDTAAPALDRFCHLELCIVDSGFTWVMVHTHENVESGAGMGGPYFVHADRVVPLIEARAPRRHR